MDMEIEKQKINITTTNGKLTVSSMMVAEHFGKDHKDVLRKTPSNYIRACLKTLDYFRTSVILRPSSIY